MRSRKDEAKGKKGGYKILKGGKVHFFFGGGGFNGAEVDLIHKKHILILRL